MRRTAITIAAGVLALGLAGCGGATYSDVTELKDAVVNDAGLSCPEFSQVDPSGYSAGHGSCQDSSFPDSGFGLDVFESAKDLEKEIASFADSPIGWCIAYGDDWAVTFAGDSQDPNCDVVADRMSDGQLKRGS